MDPKPALEAKCHAPCKPLHDLVTACADRVAKAGTGTCEPWFYDYVKCVDKCVSGPSPPALASPHASARAAAW